jgi:hypothetical protein
MNRRSDASTDVRELGALVEDIHVRMVNCSATGCLLETDKRLAEGTVATLHLSLVGRTFSDLVSVVRCEPVDGRTGLYHVGAHFLQTAPADAGSLRNVMRCEPGELAAWLDSEDGQ